MPRTFDITAASDSVRLDSSGRGETTFTVSNSSGRPQRALARAVALGTTKQEWLTIAGELERDFSADTVHQFTVRIAVAPGRCKFRLEVDSAKKAAEDHAEGPAVAFEVQPSEKPRKPFPWSIPAVMAVVLVVTGVAIYLLTRPTVPDLVNMTLDQAKSTLEEKQLTPGKVEIKDFQQGKATGTVLSQTPKAGDPIPDNKTVDLGVQATWVWFDFTEQAAVAAWSNGAESLSWSGPKDSHGSASLLLSQPLQDGSKPERVLFTHPQWVENGEIRGDFRLAGPIQTGDRFKANVGFSQGAGPGEVDFVVQVQVSGGSPGWQEVARVHNKHTAGALAQIDADLTRFAGATSVRLLVGAGASSGQDWAVWVNPRIER